MDRIGRPPIQLDKDQIINLYHQAGLSSQQIGPLLGVSWATINRRLHNWGIPIRHQYPAWNKGLTVITDERVHRNSEKSSRMSGHRHTPESKLKMSISRKGQNTWSKGSIKTEETRKRNSDASKKLWQNPEYRARQVQEMKERWADKEYADKVRPLIIKGNMQKPTQPEQQLINIINQYNLPFKYTGDGSVLIQGYSPDFVNCNGEKIVIEVFGDYWHGEGARTWKQTELGRIMAFNSFGFRCIILWERELNTLTDDAIVEKIKSEARRVPCLHGKRSKR